jgi:hypothetical protein
LKFEFDTRSEPYRLLFNEEKLRESAGFREWWSIDFPKVSYQLNDVMLDLIGLIGQNETDWPHHIYFPLIRYQDIGLCQKSEKWRYRVIHRISSKDRQKFRLFMRGEKTGVHKIAVMDEIADHLKIGHRSDRADILGRTRQHETQFP